MGKNVVLLALHQSHQKVTNYFDLLAVLTIYINILGSVSPIAVLTGHHTPIVCIAVNCSLGIVASGAMCKLRMFYYVNTTTYRTYI